MINNSVCFAFAALTVACQPKPRHPGAFQGVIEFDERLLGFEVGGRVTALQAKRGATVHAGDVLATLDDALERTTKEGREAQARAAQADVALVRAGSRPEEVRAAEAQLRAAQSNEALLEKNVAREHVLLEKNAVSPASVDELESRLRAATAERQSTEQRLRELRNGARRQEVDRAEAQAAAASNEVNLGDERVRRYSLRALEDGVVLDVHADPNEVVAAGAPVVTVADTKHPYADVFIPEGELGGVKVDTPARTSIDATPEVFASRVENVGRKTEFTPRYLFSEQERSKLVVRVRVRIDDPEQRLFAGVPAFVVLERK
jgi:HlyD family secretion protein